MESLNSLQNQNEEFYNIIKELNKTIEKVDRIVNQENEDQNLQNSEKYSNFLKWLNENGAIYSDNLIYPTSYGKYKIIGAKAKKDILPNEALFYIPKKLMIDSLELKQKEEIYSIFPKFKQLENLNVLIITIFLLKENSNKNSFWRPYLDLINSELPIFWSQDLLEQLDDEIMVESILEHKEEIKEFYEILNNLNVINCELNQFMIFYSFVLSRNFCVSEEQLLIVPFADALNHSHVNVKYECFDAENCVCKFTTEFDDSVSLKKTNNKMFFDNFNQNNIENNIVNINLNEIINTNNNLYFKSSDYFIISTSNSQTFSKNNQVYNFYGQYSNEYLLKWYGFCYFNNKYDYTSIILNLPKFEDLEFDRLLEIFFKNNLIDTENNSTMNVLKYKLKNNKINLDLINYTRFFFFYENDNINSFMEYKFNIHLEIEILNRTIELLYLSLNKKTQNFSLDEDIFILNKIVDIENENNFDDLILIQMRMINILTFRITQKMNLINQIKLCKLILTILNDVLEMSNFNFKEVTEYIKKSFEKEYNNLENKEEFLHNRQTLKKYFKQYKLL